MRTFTSLQFGQINVQTFLSNFRPRNPPNAWIRAPIDRPWYDIYGPLWHHPFNPLPPKTQRDPPTSSNHPLHSQQDPYISDYHMEMSPNPADLPLPIAPSLFPTPSLRTHPSPKTHSIASEFPPFFPHSHPSQHHRFPYGPHPQPYAVPDPFKNQFIPPPEQPWPHITHQTHNHYPSPPYQAQPIPLYYRQGVPAGSRAQTTPNAEGEAHVG